VAPAARPQVRAVVPDGSGGWFIGGDFNYVGGVPRNHLAHVRADGMGLTRAGRPAALTRPAGARAAQTEILTREWPGSDVQADRPYPRRRGA
jgi:hypothetical protein